MRSLSSAAALLAGAAALPALDALAPELGFPPPALPLDHHARAALSLADTPILDAHVAPGTGALRALLVECDPDTPLRDAVSTIAHRLATRAPHTLWLLIATQLGGRELTIATWSADRNRPRIAALFVDRTRVLPSDAETFLALSGCTADSDILSHSYWCDILGREALTRRFYRTLQRVVADLARQAHGPATPAERTELALLCVSRLLFLSFLEVKGWLDDDPRFLEHSFAQCMGTGGEYHRRTLRPLFFGTLNTPPAARAKTARAFGRIPFLNGGLFACTPLEHRRHQLLFPDEALGSVFGNLLARYRFTPREESTTWSEAAIDPEMLGKAFESLMQSNERRASGSFYTPQPLVTTITRSALIHALATSAIPPAAVDSALLGEPVEPDIARLIRQRANDIRIIDPACGSGAFLVRALETLATLAAHTGDPHPIATIRRDVLTRSIFGVDVNPMAVWLCELRLWLSVVIESNEPDPLAVTPLPNLDRHIRVGDSLAGSAFDDARLQPGGAQLARLRQRYARATGARKRSLQHALDRAERTLALAHLEDEIARCSTRRKELLSTLRGRDLFGERIRAGAAERAALTRERARAREFHTALRSLHDGGALPFAWITHFPDVARHGGFDIALGNPPWVRVHRIPAPTRARLRDQYTVFRDAAWTRGAIAAGVARGFAAQVDLAALFAERALALVHEHGTLALLLPAKLWRSLAGGGLRRLLASHARITEIEDWSESPPTFDAAVYPSILVAHRHSDGTASDTPRQCPAVAIAFHRRTTTIRWTTPHSRLTLDPDPASPWLTIPPPVRSAFDRLRRTGLPLSETALGAPLLGVKCGYNQAFVVQTIDRDGPVAIIKTAEREGPIEYDRLRPLLRGETTTPWRPSTTTTDWLVWTHDANGAPLRSLPPYTARWLAPWRRQLAARTDLRHGMPWWSLFRTPAADSRRARVAWADLGRAPRALVLPPGNCTVPLNSCYVLPCHDPADALAIAAVLNSSIAAAWLYALAEPARGGFRRLLAWTVALLPLPHDWPRARAILAPLAQRAINGDIPTADELLATTLDAYRVRHQDVAPLLAWFAH